MKKTKLYGRRQKLDSRNENTAFAAGKETRHNCHFLIIILALSRVVYLLIK